MRWPGLQAAKLLCRTSCNLASSIACDPCCQDVVLVSAERLPEGSESFPSGTSSVFPKLLGGARSLPLVPL